MYNFVLFDWLSNMHDLLHLPDTLPTSTVVLIGCLFVIAILLCVYHSMILDIADKNDILADKYNNPYSFYDGTYELPRHNIRKAMIHANLSYHTFWNAVIMFRFRACLHKSRQCYFRVNRFSNIKFPHVFVFERPIMLLSLAFIWGYPLFLLITLCRMSCYKKDLC